MPTVYLHIGAPKTATSTLQRVLSKNYQQLRNNGILYPKSCRSGDAHHVLACDLIETHQEFAMPDFWYKDIPRHTSWQLLREEIDANRDGLETIILSTELLFGQNHRLRRMLNEVKTHLSGLEIKVVAYLRRQDQLFSSFYNQDVKGERQWPGSAYEFYETHQLLRNDYVTLIQSWTAAFGKKNILLRPFEKEQWTDGSVIADFCATTGIPPLKGTFRDQNESIGATQMYMKRCLNSAGFPKRQNTEILNLLKDMFPEKPAKGLLYVNKPLYRKYRERWSRENETLSAQYLDDKPLFLQPIPEVDEVELHTVKVEDMPVLIGNCLNVLNQSGNLAHRPLFAKAIILAAIEQHFWEKLPGSARETLQNWLAEA
ncbi:MAG: hypothetical protein HKN19_03440 [Halioglobus sp.]|nr:hypothetical protein [Halioglobus sp.]